MTRRRITIQHQRVQIRRAVEQQAAPPPPRRAPARNARQASRLQPLPVRCCPSCGDVLQERHRLLGGDGSLFRKMTCTACTYTRIFKEAI